MTGAKFLADCDCIALKTPMWHTKSQQVLPMLRFVKLAAELSLPGLSGQSSSVFSHTITVRPIVAFVWGQAAFTALLSHSEILLLGIAPTLVADT